MKYFFTTGMLLLTLLLANKVTAQNSKTPQPYYKAAIGFKVFPVALTFKTMTSRKSALEFLGYFKDGFRVTVLSEYHGVLNVQKNLKWYIGGGGHIGFSDNKHGSDAKLGADGVLGLDYKFLYLPIDISADWQPALGIGDHSSFTSWGCLSVRLAL